MGSHSRVQQSPPGCPLRPWRTHRHAVPQGGHLAEVSRRRQNPRRQTKRSFARLFGGRFHDCRLLAPLLPPRRSGAPRGALVFRGHSASQLPPCHRSPARRLRLLLRRHPARRSPTRTNHRAGVVARKRCERARPAPTMTGLLRAAAAARTHAVEYCAE